ncbi:HTH_48 domain-containing protein [Trichonephila clavipes]|nr:HTH_48 domain-containing protein [Trichonephila clavipes]
MLKVIESVFLTARNTSTADIHCQITEDTEAMSDSKVRKWVRELKDGRTNVHDEERSGRLSVIAGDGFGPRTIQTP